MWIKASAIILVNRDFKLSKNWGNDCIDVRKHLSTLLSRYPMKLACRSTNAGWAVLYHILPYRATVLHTMVNAKGWSGEQSPFSKIFFAEQLCQRNIIAGKGQTCHVSNMPHYGIVLVEYVWLVRKAFHPRRVNYNRIMCVASSFYFIFPNS